METDRIARASLPALSAGAGRSPEPTFAPDDVPCADDTSPELLYRPVVPPAPAHPDESTIRPPSQATPAELRLADGISRISGSHRARELSLHHERRDADELRLGFARGFAYGAFIFATFFVVDAFLIDAEGLDVPIIFPLGMRLLGAIILGASARLLLARPIDTRPVVFTIASTLAATALIGGLIAAQTGGLDSDISDGMAFYFLGAAAFGPSPWPRMLAILLPTYLVYFVTLALAAPASPLDAIPRAFISDLAINGGLIAFASAGSDLLWKSRRLIAEVRRLGRYRLDSLLERDALSETWRAHDTTSGHSVALELYRTRPLADPGRAPNQRTTGEHDGRPSLSRERQVRFQDAAKAIAALESPQTMRIFDFGSTDDGIAFIARDFIGGERLDTLVRRLGPLPAIRAIRLVRQLAQALTEAHRQGVSHRDLRPANVFVASAEDGVDAVRLIGWGLADLIRSQEARDAVILHQGPELYRAPETFSGVSGVRADVFGLGALLYWCLTGRAPVELRAGEVPWRAHARTSLSRPSALRGELLPAGLDQLVLSCLEPDALHRPADAAEVLRMLDAIPVPD